MHRLVLEEKVNSFRSMKNKARSQSDKGGYTYKPNTECKSLESGNKENRKKYHVKNENEAFFGCNEATPMCTMIVNQQCKGKAYTVCFGEPVSSQTGSCSWVKGMTIL